MQDIQMHCPFRIDEFPQGYLESQDELGCLCTQEEHVPVFRYIKTVSLKKKRKQPPGSPVGATAVFSFPLQTVNLSLVYWYETQIDQITENVFLGRTYLVSALFPIH